jgi:hypothetical protein
LSTEPYERIALEAVTPEKLQFAGDTPVRIWSGEHGAYWRAGGSGYVACACGAGLYSLADAYRRTKHCGPEKRIAFDRPAPNLVAIEADQIVIRVPILAVPHAAGVAFDNAYGEHNYKVTDAAVFAGELVTELGREEEDGTTLIHLMLDKAVTRALENGAQGVDEETATAA